jgi:2-haloalkanoic acid dehalogenase type II
LQEYRDFTFLTHASIEFALRVVGIEPSEKITKPLFDKYLDSDPYPEVKDSLSKLRDLSGYKLAILSNGSTDMLSALVRNSGLDAYLDATISVDGARKFKPHPDCYALVEKALGLAPPVPTKGRLRMSAMKILFWHLTRFGPKSRRITTNLSAPPGARAVKVHRVGR